MRTFLVTGGAGFIGSHIATALVERGDRVRILDNLSTGSARNFEHIADRVEFIEGDIEDSRVVSAAVRGVDCIFHQAALASVPRSVEAPLDSHAACVTGSVNVLDQARRAGVKRVVYASSSSLYGDQSTPPNCETDLPAPISPYGAAKLSAEYYCKAFAATYDIETVALRYFNVFGPRQDPDSPYSAVIPIFITAILQDRRPVIYGDGLQSRDFTYVANVVEANLLAADAGGVSGQSFNVAGGQNVTLLEVLRTLNDCLETDVEPVFEQPRVGDIRKSLADISKARAALGYEGRVGFAAGVRQSIGYYRQVHEEKLAQGG
ncbi:MAG: SDR family oxidoreductase [Planctomycetota bacterium]|nr:SDR family oxidoreductase [Planctomycetota bacterium]MEE3220652.1 SDR family oxidoreductase [Planctomycetota bacterium]